MRSVAFGPLFLAIVVASAATPLNPLRTVGNIRGVQSNCKHDVSISFDDGPYINNGIVTDKVTAAGGKTTFFVNGNNYGCIYADENVLAMRHAYEAGHTFASHTWAHTDLATASIAEVQVEVEKLEVALWKILGVKPAIIRPPYGSFSDAVVEWLNNRGYTVVTWNIDSGDSLGKTANQTIQELRTSVGAGSMILAHETVASTVALVDSVTALFKERNLKIFSVDQCLDISPYMEVGTYGVPDDTWTC